MCGIAGFAALDPRRELDASPVRGMLGCIAHRGPDDEGVYQAPGVVLGHRRLSIIDVEGGHQPLFGARASTAIICNGEVYNYRELTTELAGKGHAFGSRSDTEVAAHAYDAWGLDFLDRLDGMYALALWDGERRRLVLARDRMGEKPLYYTVADGLLIFASELSAILSHPAVEARIDLPALSEYLACEYVPAPRSIIHGVMKLEPGSMLVLEDGAVKTSRYWTLQPRVADPAMPYPEAVERLRVLLEDAVKSRLVSDVPLGIFLSGGIDSSAIAALAARAGALDTFSIGFHERTFDETSYARSVAERIGSTHHERIVTLEDMHEIAPALGGMMDEPIGDASIVPTAAVSRFARERVTVALGGDGGDELFAGYPMHTAQRVAALARATPKFARAGLEAIASAMPVSHGNFALGFKARAFLRGAAAPPPLNHALWMSSFSPDEQRGLLTPEAFAGACEGKKAFRAFHAAWAGSAGQPLIGRACHLDALTYLPNDVLTKVDRASMAVALEVRAPFLSRAVVEFAFSLPDSYRMRGLTGKRILRDAVRDLLPDEVRTRRKKGFGMPVAAWLNDSLRPLVNDLFAPDRLRSGGLFRPETVQRMLREHATRRVDHRKPLWTLLVFELWREGRLRQTKPAVANCVEAVTV